MTSGRRSQFFQRETDLLRLQLVVLSQDVDECTALRPLPAMISDVSGGVQDEPSPLR